MVVPVTEHTHVFLSHNSDDKPLVERLARMMRDAGIEPWLDKWKLVPGKPWMPVVEDAQRAASVTLVCIGASGRGRFQEAEIQRALALAITDSERRVIPVLLPGAPQRLTGFLEDRHWVDLREDFESRCELLFRSIRSGAPADPGERGPERCPYLGLEAFTEEDAHRFFGRDREISDLLGLLKDKRLLFIAGASGSGKSSLVQAGLIPAISTGQLDGSYEWEVLKLRPGPRPCHALAVRMVKAMRGNAGGSSLPEELDALAALHQRLRGDPDALSNAVDLWLSGQPGRQSKLLLVVDQLEEIFTLADEQAERDGFLAALLRAGTVEGGRVHVLSTLRADFLERGLKHPLLTRFIDKPYVTFLHPMDEHGLREAILRPATQAGVTFKDGLVDTLVAEVRGQPGDLPLLQFALEHLWLHRQEGVLTWEAYKALGGLKGAITHRADTLLARWNDEERHTTRRLFGRLVQLGEGTEDTRRRASLRELKDVHPQLAEHLLEQLIHERLLTADNEHVEVAHEALIREWRTLRQWTQEDREDLRLRQELGRAAAAWEGGGRAAEYLWRGGRLQRAGELRARERIPLSQAERTFLEASEEAERRLLASERRANQRLRNAFRMAVVFAVGACLLAAYAFRTSSLATARLRSSLELASALTLQINRTLQATQGSGPVRKDMLEQVIALLEKIGADADDPETLRLRLFSYRQRSPLQYESANAEADLQAALDAAVRLGKRDPSNREMRKQQKELSFLLARARHDAGRLSEARALYEEFLATTRWLLEHDAGDISHAQSLGFGALYLSQVEVAGGDPKKARALLEMAVAVLLPVVKAYPGDTLSEFLLAQCHVELGKVQQASGGLEEARSSYEKALELTSVNNSHSVLLVPTAHELLGQMALARGDTEKALTHYTSVISTVQEVGMGSGEKQAREAASQHVNTLGSLALEKDRPEALQDFYEKLLTPAAKSFNDLSPLPHVLAASYEMLGDLAGAGGRAEEARRFHVSALAVLQALRVTGQRAEWGVMAQLHLLERMRHLALKKALTSDERRSVLTQHISAMDSMLETEPGLRMELLHSLGVVHSMIGDLELEADNLEAALAACEKAVSVREQLVKSDPDKPLFRTYLAISLRRMVVLTDSLKPQEARPWFDKAIAMFEEVVKRTPADSMPLRELGYLHQLLAHRAQKEGRWDEVSGFFQKAISYHKQSVEAEPQNTESRFFLGNTYSQWGDFLTSRDKPDEEIREKFQKGLIVMQTLARLTPDELEVKIRLSHFYNRLGSLAVASGKLEEGQKYYEADLEAVTEIARRTPGNPDYWRDLIITYNTLAEVAQERGRLEDAVAFAEKSLDVAQELTKAHPRNLQAQMDLAESNIRLGVLREESGRRDAAREPLEAGLGLLMAADSRRFKDVGVHSFGRLLGWAHRGLGRVAEASGKQEEAFAWYRKALAEREKTAEAHSHADHPHVQLELVESHLDLAGVLRKRGDSESARTHVQAAQELVARTRDKARGHVRRLSRLEARLAQGGP